MNFGPLGTEGGHRRLNVAITRAREYVEVVSSVQPSDFTLGDGGSRGPQLLKRYLEYARERACDRAADLRRQSRARRVAVRAEVATVVARLGYEVGLRRRPRPVAHRPRASAIRTIRPVSCSASSPTARNYASVPTAATVTACAAASSSSSAGGCIRSGRSTGSTTAASRCSGSSRPSPAAPRASDPHGALEPTRRDRTPSRARRRPPSAGGERERRERPLIDVREDPSALPWVHVYECADLVARRLATTSSPTPANQRRQVEMVIEVANVEAPVHIDQLTRRLADAYGVERVTQNVQTAVKRAVEKASRQASSSAAASSCGGAGRRCRRSARPIPTTRAAAATSSEIACLELTSALVGCARPARAPSSST